LRRELGKRFTVQVLRLALKAETSLRDSFICRLKEVAEDCAERELSMSSELERAFYVYHVIRERDQQSKKDLFALV